MRCLAHNRFFWDCEALETAIAEDARVWGPLGGLWVICLDEITLA
jgi:hypothetical protein